ncbi:MAG: hypothetical protein HYX52_08815 [Chloroflexi bacterium]|nr:hypothetical protein [Chloroflexota bacterium]
MLVSPTLAAGPGTTLAWGENGSGQLGAAGPSVDAPGVEGGLTDVRAIAAGGSHTLALLTDGTVRAWGRNEFGQLGDGTQVDSSTPVIVEGLSNVTAIAAGARHSLALTQDGQVFAWGDGQSGQLGNGYPGAVYDDGPTCFLIWCEFDTSGLAGDEARELLVPSPVGSPPLRGVVAIAAGERHSLAVKADGSVWAWGNNEDGQLGAGVEAYLNGPILPMPVPVGANTTRDDRLGGIASVAAGGAHSLALGRDGRLYAWGSNRTGQLGSSAAVSDGCACRVAPGLVPLINVAAMAAGQAHSLAISNDAVWGWGDNSRGQVGDGTFDMRAAPVMVPAVPNGGGLGGASPMGIAAGAFHSVAVLNQAPIDVCGSLGSLCPGVVYAWGQGSSGQLGFGDRLDRPKPLRIELLREVTAVAAGGAHTVVQGGRLVMTPIFPTEPQPTLGVAPNRPVLPPIAINSTPTPTSSPAPPAPSVATPTPTVPALRPFTPPTPTR